MASTDNPLRSVVLAKGAGNFWDNLQNVLDALWQVAVNERVERAKFEPYLLRFRKHFLELEKLGCVQLVTLKERGAPLGRITLLKKHVSQFSTPSTPRTDVATIIRKPEPVVMEPPKPVAHKPAGVVPPSRCLLFIDVPNVSFFVKNERVRDGFQPPFLSFYRADWEELRKIVCTITGVPMERQACHMYMRTLNGNATKFENRCAEIQKQGIYLTTRGKKDVDEMLVVDLVLEVVPYLKKNQHIHLMLVSGDGDYAYALKRIRTVARAAQTTVTLHVMGWKHTQSPELTELAYNNVYTIDDYLKRIDPLGASLLTEYRQKSAIAS